MSFPSEAFFAFVYQKNIPLPDGTTASFTNFPLPSQSFFIGIPYIIGFVIADTPDNAADALLYYDKPTYDALNNVPFLMDFIRDNVKLSEGVSKKIGLYGTDDSKDNTFQKTDNSFPESKEGEPPNKITKGVMMFTSHGFFQYGKQLYYFSTLDDGNTLYYGKEFDFGIPPFSVSYTIPGITVNPDNDHIYNVYRYFTDLKYGDVNLNTNPSFILGWSSSDITGDYGADIALLSMYKESGTQQGQTLPVTYNQTINSSTLIPDTTIKLISTIPSGKYYYIYDFVSATLAAIQAKNVDVYYPVPPDSTSLQQTPVFTFITKFLQSITAGNIAPGGTTTIIPDFGIGYPLNTYQITVNDDTNSTRNSTLPYNYTPPPTVNTRTYIITVNGSSDTYDTNTRTTQFIVYQYVANLAVANRVIESSLNFLTWTGGSLSSQFQYGSTTITTNGSLNFESGNKVDSGGLTAGVGYTIIPTNVNERNPASGAYPTLYFDSITSNTLIISSASSLQRYTLTWQSFYRFNSPSPDGSRQYPVTLIGNGVTKSFTSLYNVVLVPFTEVTQNVPYTVKVLDITIATDVYFFDIPYDVIITPSRINFVNTISWTAFGNQPFNVQMGNGQTQYSFTSNSPTTQTLTQDVIQQNGEISFRPVGSTKDYIIGGIYHLDANTISIPIPSSILVFSGVTFSFDVGAYLYPSDTYSLSLYRNLFVVQQLEASITNPFTWIPFKYTVAYQPGDKLYIKSNQHLNFGLSVPFTLIVNTPTNVTVTPSRINFTNTISWSVENNPVLNVRMGNYTFQSSSPYTQNFTEGMIDLSGNISFWPFGADPSRAVVASSYTLSANTISITLPSSILLFSGASFSFDVGTYLYPTDTYSLSLYRNGAVVQQLEASITNPFTWIPFKYTVTYQPGDKLYIKSNQHLNFGLSVPFTLIVNTPTNIRIVPNKINFENTISWSVENNPVLNVRMGNYTFQSSSPYTENFTEDIINPIGNISFWAIGSDPSRAVVAGSYNLSANTIFIALPSSMPIFSGVFFSYDIGAVLYRNDTYSMSLYRNGTVVEELEAIVANPFTWFPYKYAATYQPGDQIYVKSNQHLNFGLSVPFTFQVNASVTVDQSVYTIFSAIVATMTIDADTDFTVRLNGATNIPVAFTQEGNQYTIQLKDYNIALGNYQLDFLLVNSPTIIVSSPSFLVTTSVTVDKPDYTIISTVNATVYVGVPTTFTVVLQDVDQLFPPIALPSFTANLLSTYSFRLYGLPLTDANYVLQFTAGTVITSPVFFISQSYFSFDELILPIPPSRATTNTLCVTTKKNNLPTTIISIKNNIVYPTAIRGQRQFLVPCGIIPYLKELTELLKTLSLRDALIFLIQKYNIPQNTPPVTNKARTQYPTANFKVLKPIVQYAASFRLAASTTGVSVGNDIRFVDKLSDARFVTLCNDDTKTFSTAYTDMLKNATYWLSTLAPFNKDGDFTYCVVRPVNGSLKQILTASITLVNNRLVFTPYILRLVLAFYQPYGAIDMTIMYTSKSLIDIFNYLVAAYEKIYLNPATAL